MTIPRGGGPTPQARLPSPLSQLPSGPLPSAWLKPAPCAPVTAQPREEEGNMSRASVSLHRNGRDLPSSLWSLSSGDNMVRWPSVAARNWEESLSPGSRVSWKSSREPAPAWVLQPHQMTLQPSADGSGVSYKFNSALTLCTRKEHRVPQVKGSVPQDWPPLRRQSHVHIVACASEQPIKPRSRDTLFGLNHFLGRLTELRETPAFITALGSMTKDTMNSRTEKDTVGTEASRPQSCCPHEPGTHTLHHPGAPQTPFLG